jgi:2Fe-2S ferredoxin
MEDAMLDSTAEPRRPNSRLSCMLTMSAQLDGLVVHLPATQV